MSQTIHQTQFSPDDIEALSPTMKIGLLATVDPAGRPHITLLSSLRANTPTQMVFGQFTEGTSKGFVKANPRAGFLVMTLDKEMWRGRATYSHSATQGPEFEMYNNTPMFRYNAYFGVHTVHYLDLVEQSGRQPLPMAQVIFGAVQTMLVKLVSRERRSGQVLNPWTQGLLNKLDNLKFLAYIGGDGYPVLVPVIQAQASDAEHVIFSTGAFGPELEQVPAGSVVALFAMSLDMETVLLRGGYEGLTRTAGLRHGRLTIDWVYNPMPPKPQQIYPPLAIEPVTVF